jgi:hypothetical protein
MLGFGDAKTHSHRFVSDLQAYIVMCSSVIDSTSDLDHSGNIPLTANKAKMKKYHFISLFCIMCNTCLTSLMRDSTRVFTFARGPVTPETLTYDYK